MTLTRDAVVDAAVELLGEVGLEGLSLRRLARELGVSAPTLYWHVADKRTLLDHVAQQVHRGVDHGVAGQRHRSSLPSRTP
jgi:TetR/AcrR family tetracycline transcriptional repressor